MVLNCEGRARQSIILGGKVAKNNRGAENCVFGSHRGMRTEVIKRRGLPEQNISNYHPEHVHDCTGLPSKIGNLIIARGGLSMRY